MQIPRQKDQTPEKQREEEEDALTRLEANEQQLLKAKWKSDMLDSLKWMDEEEVTWPTKRTNKKEKSVRSATTKVDGPPQARGALLGLSH